MDKISKSIMRAFGAKPNGTDKTSCVNDTLLVKQMVQLLSLAFLAGAMTFGYKGIPNKMRAVEDKVIVIEQKLTVLESIDARLGRIEGALISRR